MPGMGKAHGAAAAACPRSSFPNVRLALLGSMAVSRYRDIFLGDFILSTGVIQCDFGRQYDGRRIMRKGTLEDNFGRPSREIQSFLQQLQSSTCTTRVRRHASTYLSEICQKGAFGSWERPLAQDDELYHAEYLQQHHTTMNHSVCSSSTICDVAPHLPGEQLQCSPDALVTRTPAYAETSAPQIHFGRFALGDQVTKSGTSRDLISKANDMGFEMEGAGTWDIMPTIIIKDVCDHTDSHKNKKWQRFASVAVAACAKAVL